MAPIRVALIGLSQSAKTSWATEAHLPYLLSNRGKQKYKIVALLNSSEAAAKRSIESFDLGPDVKAYGSPQELAADPDIDLVACTTRVDVHFPTVKPSIEAGKAAFVEWPLAENAQRAAELATLVERTGAPTFVGLQGRVSPIIRKLADTLRDGVIGKVLSSKVDAYSIFSARDTVSEGMSYFLNKQIGGNSITIAVGHLIDTIHSVLGEYVSSNAHTQIQRPDWAVTDAETGAKRSAKCDVPDLLSLHGTLSASSYVAEGASLVVNFRRSTPFPGITPFVWTINGEKGEIRVTNKNGVYLSAEGDKSAIKTEVHSFATDTVETLDWDFEEWQESLPPRSKNIAKLYDLYADGQLAEYGGVDFASAVKRHEQLDRLLWP
ncbi:hypothetical protein BAUCODRAFT_70124 [Baudoinia panamericana UAMH 10762]|uniref:Uncharacterized protein n=1 Tax=Baudoinia panamericana (strain UAMH 10762) TaxID=717646 RepID=M2NBJ8_BAUPA|nr:uncharacterized protein BAUCODRAFT_70124 [Baudoinia panamericana UAMH 10762]EMC96280.1 hypothetical protein BAUCODRAFT_70124 [Baudoinia panamericana UAMH 10762]